jgi:hypothetical protein
VVTDEAVWILGIAEQARFDNPKGRCPARATDAFDRPSDPIAPGGVVVECDHDRLDAMPPKPNDRGCRYACAAGRDNGPITVPAEVMDVDQALNEHDLSALRRRQAQNLGQSVWREVSAGCSAEVEVTRRGMGVVKGTSPERSDSPTFISPGAAKPARPAAVRKHPGLCDLELGVPGRLEGVLREHLRRNDA